MSSQERRRPKPARLLRDPEVQPIVVVDTSETADDLVRDMVEVLTPMCARLYGRRGTRNRSMRAVTATKHGPAGDVV